MLCNVAADLPTAAYRFGQRELRGKRTLPPIMPTKSSHQPRHIYYEVHGDLKASQKIVLVMVQYFSKRKDHVVLVFDNRGTGNSNAGAIEAYRTSDMAQDTVTLLNWLGWNQDRSLHLFGMSLGGMIAQELVRESSRGLACLIVPKRFKSATFISTRCGKRRLGGFSEDICEEGERRPGVGSVSQRFVSKGIYGNCSRARHATQERLARKLRNCHRLPREQAPIHSWDTFNAATHASLPSPEIAQDRADLSPPKMLILTGGSDELIPTKRSLELHKNLPGSELVVLENAGHALIFQLSEEVNTIMERAIVEGNQAFKTCTVVDLFGSI
ncbi:hypothetical protein PGT21_004537 [Puccinia graminis f. sp. tritici]|uniref:AB hydrolase-1 domain-containing protein n=1 Tax=Puccinia graminis f. sp. tritici TaxID=56615 RepID=A0A5B0P518_PUCGR|nr:hypothetical protein PGT21_004537 [Puccinia graminis f. sp. tritici]